MSFKSFFSFIASLVLAQSALAEPLNVGAVAPEVSALNQAGEEVSLADFYKKGPVLVYFYPKADTPGCTAQACSLRDAYTEIEDEGITVIGVSMDTVEKQKAFKEKYNLPFTLLADPEAKVVDAFGVPHRANFSSRQAFLIHEGKIVWRDLKASTSKQAEDLLVAWAEIKKATSGS